MTGIPCPRCGGDTYVIETRTCDGQIRRRRGCINRGGCGGRVTTVEMAVPAARRGLKLLSDMVVLPRLVFDRLLELQVMITEIDGYVQGRGDKGTEDAGEVRTEEIRRDVNADLPFVCDACNYSQLHSGPCNSCGGAVRAR